MRLAGTVNDNELGVGSTGRAHRPAPPLIPLKFSDNCVPAFIHRLLNEFMNWIMHGETNCSSQVRGVAGIGLDEMMGGVSGVSHEA